MSEAPAPPTVVPLLWYDRPRLAIEWLEQAFGFETAVVVADDGDGVIHSELTYGGGMIYVVGPSSEELAGASPLRTGGKNTQTTHLNLTGELDSHFARAKAAGARIGREPADQHYGARVYTCADLEGHQWSFSQPVKAMSYEEMAQATGRKIETPDGAHG
jgi:uncharacterized glyoxalase superfamily protein PhnB